MSETVEKYISLTDGLKSLKTTEIEECIANAIESAIGCSGKVSCSISTIEHRGVRGSNISLSLKVEHDELDF
ncbi:hypothetical protein N9842_01100 [Porticoccaceae bacterium]|nr:hypothetical protein [Porticoccaceae bacterium]